MSIDGRTTMLAAMGKYFKKVSDRLDNMVTIELIDKYGVKGDSVTNDTAAFDRLELAVKGNQVNLLGRVCLVTRVPVANVYYNGYFLNTQGKIFPSINDPTDLLYTDVKAIPLWATFPTAWSAERTNPASGSPARNNAPTVAFGSMSPHAAEQTAFNKGFMQVAGNMMVGVTTSFSYTGTITQGSLGFVIDTIDMDGNYTRRKFPVPVITTQWRPATEQYRLPIRTAMYRVGLYRAGTTDTGSVFFSKFKSELVSDPVFLTGMGMLNSSIDIRKGCIKPIRLMNFTRIGPDPWTAFQDFELIPNTEDLFIGSGVELVVGSGIDALIVNQLTRGETEVTATSFQTALESSTGHAGISLEALNTGAYRIWTGGATGGTAVRFRYGGTPTGAPAANVGTYQLFDSGYGDSTFPTVSSDGHWLCAIGRGNTNAQVVRIWRIADLQQPGDCRNTYVHEFDIPADFLGSGFPMQGVAFNENHIFMVTGGFSPGTAGSIKLIQMTMLGDVVAFMPDLRIGEEDYIKNGSAWEPEGLSIYKPGPNSTPCLAIGMKTGAGASKTSTIWLLGAGGDTLQHSSVTVKKGGNVGFTFYRDNSDVNAYHAVRTTTGTIYIGTGDGKNFVANSSPNNTDSLLVAETTALRTGKDNRATLGGPTYRFTDVFATGAILTSDEREKTEINAIRERILDAWESIEYSEFKWKDSVTEKGDLARIHFGVMAQRVEQVFRDNGIDPFEFGVLCYDSWDDIYSETGDLVIKAGNRYGVRYLEATCIEAAMQRRKVSRMETTLVKVMARLDKLEKV